jgi:hypothetical protein
LTLTAGREGIDLRVDAPAGTSSFDTPKTDDDIRRDAVLL